MFGIVLLVSGYLLGTMLFDVPATENKFGIGTNKPVSLDDVSRVSLKDGQTQIRTEILPERIRLFDSSGNPLVFINKAQKRTKAITEDIEVVRLLIEERVTEEEQAVEPEGMDAK